MCECGSVPATQLGRNTFVGRAEVELPVNDPKDRELYLRRVKPGEILVEARSGSDVKSIVKRG